MKSVFGPVPQTSVRGYVVQVRYRQTVYQIAAVDDSGYVQAQPAVINLEAGFQPSDPIATGCPYRKGQLPRQLPRRTDSQDIDVTDFSNEAVREQRRATEDCVTV